MKKNRIGMIFISCIAVINLLGCAENAIYHAVVEGYPKMAKRYQTLAPVGQNDARLILYWPEKSFFQGSGLRIFIDGDNGTAHSDVGYRTAELFDLPSGNYSIRLSGNKKKIRFEASHGDTYCYNVTELKAWSDNQADQTESPLPTPIGVCISDFSEDDIRCAHKECLVKTVVPKKTRVFRQYNLKMDEDRLEQEARNFHISKEVSRIYITRRMYTLGMVSVGVDGKPVTKVDSSSFVVYEVKPGAHTVIAAIGGVHNIEQAYRLSAKPGECYFFHSDTFRFLDPEEGKELVKDYDLIDEGFFKE